MLSNWILVKWQIKRIWRGGMSVCSYRNEWEILLTIYPSEIFIPAQHLSWLWLLQTYRRRRCTLPHQAWFMQNFNLFLFFLIQFTGGGGMLWDNAECEQSTCKICLKSPYAKYITKIKLSTWDNISKGFKHSVIRLRSSGDLNYSTVTINNTTVL